MHAVLVKVKLSENADPTILREWRLVPRPEAKVRELPMVTVQPSGLRMVAQRRPV